MEGDKSGEHQHRASGTWHSATLSRGMKRINLCTRIIISPLFARSGRVAHARRQAWRTNDHKRISSTQRGYFATHTRCRGIIFANICASNQRIGSAHSQVARSCARGAHVVSDARITSCARRRWREARVMPAHAAA